MWSKPQAHGTQILFLTLCHYLIVFSEPPGQTFFQDKTGFSSRPRLSSSCCWASSSQTHTTKCNGHVRGVRHWPYQLPCSAGVGGRRIQGPLPHSLISFPLSCRQETHYCNNRSLGSAGKGEQCRAAPAGRPKARTTRGVAMPAASSSPAPPLSKEKMRLQHPTDRKTWCKGIRGTQMPTTTLSPSSPLPGGTRCALAGPSAPGPPAAILATGRGGRKGRGQGGAEQGGGGAQADQDPGGNGRRRGSGRVCAAKRSAPRATERKRPVGLRAETLCRKKQNKRRKIQGNMAGGGRPRRRVELKLFPVRFFSKQI